MSSSIVQSHTCVKNISWATNESCLWESNDVGTLGILSAFISLPFTTASEWLVVTSSGRILATEHLSHEPPDLFLHDLGVHLAVLSIELLLHIFSKLFHLGSESFLVELEG